MKFIQFEGGIDIQSFADFMNVVNEIKDEEIVLYFESTGGETKVGHMFIDLINRLPSVIVVCPGNINSCGLDIFLNSKVKERVLLPHARALYHRGSWSFNNVYIEKREPTTMFLQEMYEKEEIEELKFAMRILTDLEFEIYKRGDDVLLNRDRLCEIIKKLDI